MQHLTLFANIYDAEPVRVCVTACAYVVCCTRYYECVGTALDRLATSMLLNPFACTFCSSVYILWLCCDTVCLNSCADAARRMLYLSAILRTVGVLGTIQLRYVQAKALDNLVLVSLH
jgi:hypothetical protein